MIAYLEGKLLERSENSCILLTSGGVGYEVTLPGHTWAELPGTGETATFYIATVVREDALELYGFATRDEREMFLLLTSISRVGARTAMAILTVYRPDDLRRMAAEEDMISLTRVSGIGKKSGQQIFLELKYKLKGTVTPVAQGPTLKVGSVAGDGVAGLVNLGYAEEEALAAVTTVMGNEPDLDVSGVLRSALKSLAQNR